MSPQYVYQQSRDDSCFKKLKGSFLLTGASGTIGRNIGSQIAAHGEYTEKYYGIYIVRDASAALSLYSDLKRYRHSFEIATLDLTSIEDVRAHAKELNGRISKDEIPPLQALVLNAAYLELFTQTWTEDGFDTSFASAYLGHWLMTVMLLQSMNHDIGRVVVVGSSVHDTRSNHNSVGGQYRHPKWHTIFHESTEPLARGTWSTNDDDPSFRSGYRRYGAAKLCQVMMIPELQKRLSQDPTLSNVSVLGVDPGATPSGITRRGGWIVHVFIGQYLIAILAIISAWFSSHSSLRTNTKAAKDIVAAMFECNGTLSERPKGVYLDGDIIVEMAREARDSRKTEILWKDTLRYTRLRQDDTVLFHWN